MTEPDPWSALSPPTTESELITRRVDATLRWDLFWAIDRLRRCHLTLIHDRTACEGLELPELKGVEIRDIIGDSDDRHTLSIMLLSGEDRDLFYTLCADIIEAVSPLDNEKSAVSIAVQRAWRWHHLLRTGRSSRLSEESEKGLIGELLLLESTLIPRLGESAAITSWQGPLGAPKDFELNRIAIEVKTRRGGTGACVSISSVDQLDISGVDSLFLRVVELDRAQGEVPESFTLDDIAGRMRDGLVGSALIEFERRLEAAGYRDEDGYRTAWIEGNGKYFEVAEAFPRISPGDVPTGVQDIRYRIALAAISDFEVDAGTVRFTLEGAKS